MAVVPELGGDEDFGAGDARLFDGLAYGGLSAWVGIEISIGVPSRWGFR